MRTSLISFTFLLAATVLLVSGCGGCSTGYQQVDGKWAYVTINTGAGRSVNYIEGADQETFEVLAEDIYAKDKNRVYYWSNPIPNADAETFRVLQDQQYYPYAKDKTHVFLTDWVVQDADPDTFELITFPYARDRSNVYCGTFRLPVDNVDAFKILKGSGSTVGDRAGIDGKGWSTDGVSVFYGRKSVPGVDVATFQALSEIYGKDRQHVYYHDRVVPLADPATFKTTGYITGEDKNRRFSMDKPIPKR